MAINISLVSFLDMFAFIHPKAVNGVLLELIDYKWDELKDKK